MCRSLLVGFLLLLLMGCYFPSGKYTSTLQSAKTLEAKELETTLVGAIQNDTKNPEDKQWYIGIREAIGVSQRFNVRLSMILMHHENILKEGDFTLSNDFDEHQNIFFSEVELKWSPGNQHYFAFTIPVGARFEIGNTDYYISPLLIGSIYPTKTVALTTSLKFPIQIRSQEFSQAINLGITFTPKRVPLTVTPELGILWSQNSRTTSGALSFGFIKRRLK